MQALLLTDIDGTLIKTNEPIHPRALLAAQSFMAAGGRLALCTGRAARAAEATAAQLSVNAPCILCGGSMLYDFQEKKMLWGSPLPGESVALIEWMLEHRPSFSVTVYTETGIYTIRSNKRLLERGVMEDREAPVLPLRAIQGAFYKILVVDDDETLLTSLPAQLPLLEQFAYVAASRHFYEITAKGVSKGAAAARLLAHMGGETVLYAAGDAPSDLTMQPYAKRFFAPVSAAEAVRAKADFVFPSPGEGGWAEVVERIME